MATPTGIQQTQQPSPAPQSLEIVPTASIVTALVPTTLDGAMRLASWLAQSSLLPKSVNREHDIFFIVVAGMELGIPPMAALRSLYVVNGRTALESKAKMSLCLSKGAAVYFRRTEYTPEATTWETLRRGQTEPVKMRYTRQEAIAAFLAPGPNPDGKGPPVAGKEGPWRLYTQRMISHRALGWICDDVYPDVVLGVATAEDFDDEEFTFRPISTGVDHGTQAQPVHGVPTTAKSGTPRTQKAPADPPQSQPTTPPPAQHDQQTSKASGPPLSEDDIIELITAIGNCGTVATLKQIAKERINNRQMDPGTRQKLLNHYEAQIELIMKADKGAPQ